MKKIVILFLMMFSFTQGIGNLTWASPTTLSTTNVDASDPRVVIDPSGNAVALWVESNLITASSQPVGGSWSAAVTLSGTTASSPKIGVDSNGNAIAIWVENGYVKSSNLPFGGSWTAATTLSDVGATTPQLAVNSSGEAVAIWQRNGFIEATTQVFGGSWSFVYMLSASNSDHPHVDIGDDGTIVAVWHSSLNSLDTIISTNSVIGGAWKTPVTISQTMTVFNSVGIDSVVTRHNYPHVAVDANGNGLAVWFGYEQTGLNYIDVALSAELPANSNWKPTVVISELGFRNPADLKSTVAFDPNGNAISLWTNSTFGSTFNIETAAKPLGQSWTLSVQLVAENFYAYQGDLSISSIGDVLATVMYYDGSSLVIQSMESDTTGTAEEFWTVPFNISTGSENGFPRCAISDTGSAVNGVAVWISSDGVYNTIQSATGMGSVVAPPTDLSVVQGSNDFGIFTEYYNTFSWQASSSPTLAGYVIYRNGIQFNRVDSSVLQITEDNVTQNGTVTYGVSAYDFDKDQSAIITISFP